MDLLAQLSLSLLNIKQQRSTRRERVWMATLATLANTLLPQGGVWHQCLLPLHMSVLAGECGPDVATKGFWNPKLRSTEELLQRPLWFLWCTGVASVSIYVCLFASYAWNAVSLTSQHCHWWKKSMLHTSYIIWWWSCGLDRKPGSICLHVEECA